MTQCIHTDEDALPEFLCRRCHPELNLTKEQRAKLDAADEAKRRAQQQRERDEREVRRIEKRLAGLTKYGEPDEGSVNEKVVAALRAKAERLSHD